MKKIFELYQPQEITNSFGEAILIAGAKAKVFLTDKFCDLIPLLNKISSSRLPLEVFPVVYKLMDEYIAGRGKNISPDLKLNIERLV